MLKADPSPNRAPRGTKPVSQAFFTALDAVPEASRSAVAKAAQAMIKDELKSRKDKMKLVATKSKAAKPADVAKKTPAAAKAPARKTAAKPKAAAPSKANGAEPAAAPAKRRTRKPADVPSAA